MPTRAASQLVETEPAANGPDDIATSHGTKPEKEKIGPERTLT
jgi:hypothetical protein